MRDNSRQPGDKLMPKLMQAIIQTTIATRKGLTGHEHELRVNAGQELIDRMGREVASLFEPFLRPALSDERLSPIARDFLGKISSGRDQWQAVAGMAFGASGVPNVLSQIIGNELAPLGYDLISTNPHLIPDLGSVINAYTRRIITEQEAQSNVAKLGYDDGWFGAVASTAWNWPSIDIAYQLFRRGYLQESDLITLIERNGVPDDYVNMIAGVVTNVLSVADAALAVLRTDLTLDEGRLIANKNGYTDDDFNTLLLNTGEPPGAQELMEAYRRGFIDEAQFKLGIAQSRVRNQWTDTLLKLRYSPLNTADAVNAYVEGYVDEATVRSVADQNGLEPEQYKTLINAAGDPLSYTDMMRLWRYGDATQADVEAALKRGRLKDDYIPFALRLKDAPMSVADAVEAKVQGYLSLADAKAIMSMDGLREQDQDILISTAGSPASRTEMIELWRRNLVSQTQVEDALRQSRLKDEYIPEILKLKLQLPALYETRALLADGGLSASQGTQILLAQGYDDSVVKAIVSNALGQTTTVHKGITEAIYADLYKEKAITASELQEALRTLGYSQADGLLIQEVYDNQLAITQRNSVVTKVKAAYITRKFTQPEAESELNQLGLSAAMVDQLIVDWDIIQSTEIKLLTPAQVVDAWQMGLLNQDDPAANTTAALGYLATLGYSADDAILLLEIKIKGPLTNGSTNKQVPASETTSSTPETTG